MAPFALCPLSQRADLAAAWIGAARDGCEFAARRGHGDPGYAATNSQAIEQERLMMRIADVLMKVANRMMAQSAEMGALPTLYAALANDVHGDEYHYSGPTGTLGGRVPRCPPKHSLSISGLGRAISVGRGCHGWVRVDLGWGMYCLARAYSLALASVVAPFEYVALPINLMWSFLL